jgi:hypothetical protein
LAIVLSVLLRYTDADYPFGIFKLFLQQYNKTTDKQTYLKKNILWNKVETES